MTPDDIEGIRGKATIPLWPDAANILGCSRNVAYDAARRGAIPTLRLGRNIRVPVPKLLALLGADGPTTSAAQLAEAELAALGGATVG